MHPIDVDFDVFKALTNLRTSEGVTYNDVLHKLLNLPTAPPRPREPSTIGDWTWKGVRFPAGTEFRASYHGQTILAKVADGALLLNGERFTSPSGAAVTITGGPVNGWTFWECKVPGASAWRLIKSMRQ